MKCLDVVKEDMQDVGAREDEVFGCGEGGRCKMKCLDVVKEERGKMKCLDVVKEDMQDVGARED